MKNRLMKPKSLWSTIITGNTSSGLSNPEKLYGLAEQDALRDKLRAGLFKQAMDNTAMLAMTEEQLTTLAPAASKEYHLIVEAYVRKALMEIIGGEW